MSLIQGKTERQARTGKKSFIRAISRYKYAYLMLLPGFIMLVVFRYIPMYGIIMAFEKYRVASGVLGSKWIWFNNFIEFFKNPYSLILIRNTFLLGLYTLIWAFPMPIMLALAFNEIRSRNTRKILQSLSYLPYFVSTVVIIGLLKEFLLLDTGIINKLISSLGGVEINFFSEARWFRTIYIFSTIWQGVGFSSIIYLAAISGINPELYECARLEGAGRFKCIVHITIPSIVPTIIIILILNIGGILGNDFTKILLIYTGPIYDVADVIQTYVYRLGIAGGQYSLTTAIGLFTSVISFILLYSANAFSRKMEANSIW
jgi:putative aldouronate transport system permease protein